MLSFVMSLMLAQTVPQYRAFVIDCWDGDSCKIAMQEPLRSVFGFDMLITHHETMRFCGLNAPELSTGEPGKASRDYVLSRVRAAKNVEIRPYVRNQRVDRDKYGRLLGWLIVDGVDLNAELIAKNLAVPYIECR